MERARRPAGGLARSAPHRAGQIITFVLRYLPVQFHFIIEQLNRFESATLTFGVTGSLALIWSALGVFGAVSTAVNYAWGVPNAHVRLRDMWLGAIVTGLVWRLALFGFSLYVHDLSQWSVNGSIAAVVVFLVWVYVSAVVLLYGTQFTAAHARLRLGLPPAAPAAPAIEK